MDSTFLGGEKSHAGYFDPAIKKNVDPTQTYDAEEPEYERTKDPYSGKTYRRKGNVCRFVRELGNTISIDRNRQGDNREVLTTEVDDMICTIVNSWIYRSEFSENKKNLWEAKKIIDESAISKTSSVNEKRGGILVEKYVVPATGSTIIDTGTQIKSNPIRQNNWFECNGKTYDPSYLYVVDEFRMTFTPLCELQPSVPNLGKNIGILKADIYKYANKNKINCAYGGRIIGDNWYGRPITDTNTSIFVDFKSPQMITHIGTFGKSPDYRTWHSKYQFAKYQRYKVKKSRLSRCKGSIAVVTQHQYAYTTSFKIDYKDPTTHKWISIGIFDGNHNPFNMNIIELNEHFNKENGLYTKSLRITPIEYNLRPSMRLQLFGTTCHQETIDEPEVVEYTITSHPVNDWDYDNSDRSGHWRDYYKLHKRSIRKGKKKRSFDDDVNDAIDELYYE